MFIARFAGALSVLGIASTCVAQVERYRTESEFLNRLTQLGLTEIAVEGFESAAWDGVRSPDIFDPHFAASVVSNGVTWTAAAKDIWGDAVSTQPHGITTNHNWAYTGQWGVYEYHNGEPYPTTIRISSDQPLFAVGGWFNTNPDLQSVGFLFEGRTTANQPGYVLDGLGAMYPGDTPTTGHEFVGIVDPGGFTSVVLTGTLEINEEGVLEGGIIFGADDFTFAISTPAPCPNDPSGTQCDTDVTGDCVVNNEDLGVVLAAYLSDIADPAFNEAVNFDDSGASNGRIDNADLGELLADYLNNCD